MAGLVALVATGFVLWRAVDTAGPAKMRGRVGAAVVEADAMQLTPPLPPPNVALVHTTSKTGCITAGACGPGRQPFSVQRLTGMRVRRAAGCGQNVGQRHGGPRALPSARMAVGLSGAAQLGSTHVQLWVWTDGGIEAWFRRNFEPGHLWRSMRQSARRVVAAADGAAVRRRTSLRSGTRTVGGAGTRRAGAGCLRPT